MKEVWKKYSHTFFCIWSWSIRLFSLYFVKKVKISPLPKGPFIIISNHSSYLDIFLMHSILPRSPFVFLGKSELLKYPILGSYFKLLHIPVFRDNKMKAAKSFVQAKQMVKKGWSLMIFPEGGIPDDNVPHMAPFKEGAFKLAKNLSIPIIPLTFTNSYKLFSDPSNYFGGARPGIMSVFVHDYVSPELIATLTEEELMKKCFDIINEPLLQDKRLEDKRIDYKCRK